MTESEEENLRAMVRKQADRILMLCEEIAAQRSLIRRAHSLLLHSVKPNEAVTTWSRDPVNAWMADVMHAAMEGAPKMLPALRLARALLYRYHGPGCGIPNCSECAVANDTIAKIDTVLAAFPEPITHWPESGETGKAD